MKPLATQTQLVDVIDVANTLGESVVWDDRLQSVWWTDIMENKIFRITWPEKKIEKFSTPERACAIGLTTDEKILIVAFETGIALFNPKKSKAPLNWLYRPFLLGEGIRFNDGRVDRNGRFWVSTMIEKPDKVNLDCAQLVCLSNGAKVTHHLSEFSVGNSLCWSPDSSRIFFADSPTRKIWGFDFNAEQGCFTNKKIFKHYHSGVYPDGADIDSLGNLWCAEWAGSSVSQYDQQGRQLSQIAIPTSQPTCVAFGGENLDLLFVTSATYAKSKEDLLKEPDAGNVFVYKVPAKGLAAPKFRIEDE